MHQPHLSDQEDVRGRRMHQHQDGNQFEFLGWQKPACEDKLSPDIAKHEIEFK